MTLHDDAVLLTFSGQDAARVAPVLRQALRVVEGRDGLRPPTLEALVREFTKAEEKFREAELRKSRAGNGDQDEPGTGGSGSDDGCGVLTVQEAAQRLGITTRGVRQLAAKGLLLGYRTGPRGAWELDAVAVQVRAAIRRAAS